MVLHPDHSFVRQQIAVAGQYSSADTAPLVMPAKSAIEGILKVEHILQAEVLVVISSDVQGLPLFDLSTATNADGFFSIKVDSNDTYRLLIQGDETELADRYVSIAPGQTLATLPTIDLQGAGSITGTVSDLSGNGVSGIVVEVHLPDLDGEDGLVYSTVSGSAGAYSFDKVQPISGGRTYTVQAWQASGEEYYLFAQKEYVTVAPAPPTTLVDLQPESHTV